MLGPLLADERERCAKLCDQIAAESSDQQAREAAQRCAAAIRGLSAMPTFTPPSPEHFSGT